MTPQHQIPASVTLVVLAQGHERLGLALAGKLVQERDLQADAFPILREEPSGAGLAHAPDVIVLRFIHGYRTLRYGLAREVDRIAEAVHIASLIINAPMGHHADDLTREVDHGATAASQAAERIEHVIQRRGDPLAPPGRSRDNPEGNQQDITLDSVLRVSHDRDEIARRNLRLRRHWERGGTGHGLMWTQQYNIVERQPVTSRQVV